LRDEYAALTRRRIVAAFVETLEDEAADDVSVAAVARRANYLDRARAELPPKLSPESMGRIHPFAPTKR